MNATKTAIALYLLLGFTYAQAADNHQYYQRAFDVAYSEYKSAYKELNKTVEHCSLQKRTDINFKLVAKEIPSDLTKLQLKAALYLMKKQHSDKCARSAIGNYMQKATDLKSLLGQFKTKKIKISTHKNVETIRKLLNSRKKTLFYVPESYFPMLASYQSISAQDRSKIESIPELKSDYDLVKLLNALGNRDNHK